MKKSGIMLIVALFAIVSITGCASMSGDKVIATGPCLSPAPIAVAAPAISVIPIKVPVLSDVVIYFDFDKSALKDMKPAEIAKMKDLVAFLKANQSVEVKLTGHTDWFGSDTYNMKLSEKRANTVKIYLIDNGVTASRIRTFARGESELVSKTVSKLDRRVVVIQIK